MYTKCSYNVILDVDKSCFSGGCGVSITGSRCAGWRLRRNKSLRPIGVGVPCSCCWFSRGWMAQRRGKQGTTWLILAADSWPTGTKSRKHACEQLMGKPNGLRLLPWTLALPQRTQAMVQSVSWISSLVILDQSNFPLVRQVRQGAMKEGKQIGESIK